MNKVLHSFIHSFMSRKRKFYRPPPPPLDEAAKYTQSSISANVNPPLTLTQRRHPANTLFIALILIFIPFYIALVSCSRLKTGVQLIENIQEAEGILRKGISKNRFDLPLQTVHTSYDVIM